MAVEMGEVIGNSVKFDCGDRAGEIEAIVLYYVTLTLLYMCNELFACHNCVGHSSTDPQGDLNE